MTHKNYQLYIASGADNGGIYHYRFNESGESHLENFYPIGKTMYLAEENNCLYALAAISKENDGGLTSFLIEKDGTLSNQTDFIPTKGKEVCHLLVDQGTVYCANYDSGSLICLPDHLIQHSGHSVDPERQSSAHTHFVGETPDKLYLCVVDLGLDKIILYDKNLQFVSEVSAPIGHGPRHVVFSKDGKTMFCANELKSTISVFSYEKGKLHLLHTISCLPEDYTGESFAAAIRLSEDGQYLFVSNRGHNSIGCFKVNGESLTAVSFTDCGGNWPRDFILHDNLLFCTNEYSHQVTIFERDRATLSKLNLEISVPSPLSILAFEEK
ncbi:lactonase family protein [Scatolibacter rhodanostii]|uniref:lactonase family protein n=1 Tax=Scatolibacter rhodanostii TaxID=2014781 RepID=UPI000C0763F8|nr:lactonase family protein [Scatolibacter rhodanostii]